jgi:hypothetical protein
VKVEGMLGNLQKYEKQGEKSMIRLWPLLTMTEGFVNMKSGLAGGDDHPTVFALRANLTMSAVLFPDYSFSP